MPIQVHRLKRMHTSSWRWWYVRLFGWEPFARFGHGGWMFLGLSWLRRHCAAKAKRGGA